MPRGEGFSRSRNGCLECRKKHNKCDERRPNCTFCALRGLNCQWPLGLKWVEQAQPTLERHRSRHSADKQDLSNIPRIVTRGLFDSEDEKNAWEYYVKMVSTNVPAMDGPDNPYRQVSMIALSSPILRETIVCIATEHMLNFGLGSVSTAVQRQQRMLRTIRHNLSLVESAGAEESRLVVANRPDYDALFVAIVLQGVVVAQSEDGVLEPHVKCASFLMETLYHFNRVPRSIATRMAVQRFTMVDVMLAIFRQRRPYAPRNFVLYQPDPSRWDATEPSFHKMTGCPQPLMCFLVRIAHLACDIEELLEYGTSIDDILTQAYTLQSELRSWGSGYMIEDVPDKGVRSPLETLTACFYWTAHLLLDRRVFRNTTRCARVQHLAQTCFRLMDQLSTGCGPDSSLPGPFYLAAREAVTPEDRAWVRQKHGAMTEYYREKQRNLAMRQTERVWEIIDQIQEPTGSISLETDDRIDREIKAIDREACLFIF